MLDSATIFETNVEVTGNSVATDGLDWSVVEGEFDTGKPVDAVVLVSESFGGDLDPWHTALEKGHLRLILQSAGASNFTDVGIIYRTEWLGVKDLKKGAEYRLQLMRRHERYLRLYYELSLINPGNQEWVHDAPEWDLDDAPYAEDAVVTHDGRQWKANTSTSEEPSGASDDWDEEVDDWSDQEDNYAIGDMVYHDDQHWIAVEEPTTADEPGGDKVVEGETVPVTAWEKCPPHWDDFTQGKLTAHLEQGH